MTNTKTAAAMTQSDLTKAFRDLGAKVAPKAWDGACDGQVVTTYGVLVSISKFGSTEVRTIREGEAVDPPAVVKEMHKALASRNKTTRAAIRSERKAT